MDRYFRQFRQPDFFRRRAEIAAKATTSHSGIKTLLYGIILTWNLLLTLLRDGSLKKTGRVYLRYFLAHSMRYQRGIVGFAQFMNRCATHWHFYKFTREAVAGRLRLYNSG
jgi:hypothetical protein